MADDGHGMNEAILDQAMRLGSLTSRNTNSDLGKFGMGLVTGSLSVAKKCHVITRSDEGCWSSAWDVEEVMGRNAFVKHLDKAANDEAEMLREEIGDTTGTIVVLSKCDNLTNKNTSSFASNLRSHLGRVHRYFVDAGKTITVNGEPVPSLDPLQLSDRDTEIVMDEVIPVTFTEDGEKKSENVRVRIVLVPEAPITDLDIGKSLAGC